MMPDQLHLAEEGYRILAETLHGPLLRLLSAS
jgi:hypothetical protein